MDYKPKPIDTTSVQLSKDLKLLLERLARNTHENWASHRICEGWTYGPNRDDTKQTNPCLIPYKELPENEKVIDRTSSLETLKAILKLGYQIHSPKRKSNSDHFLGPDREYIGIEALKNLSSNELLTIWQDHNPSKSSKYPELYLALGDRVLKLGEALVAYDILSVGLGEISTYIDDRKLGVRKYKKIQLRLRQLQALALAQSGAVLEANQGLEQLRDEGFNDGETLRILGRTYKDLGMTIFTGKNSKIYLQFALNTYCEGFAVARRNRRVEDAYYTGINAATLALLVGDLAKSKEIANQVKVICEKKLRRDRKQKLDSSRWLYATLGEAELLLENLAQSK